MPAQSILEQFDQAVRECQDTSKLAAWVPMLAQYGPDILKLCEEASEMSQELTRGWLERYMLRDRDDGPRTAAAISAWLSDHRRLKSHSRHITREQLADRGFRIERLEDDQQLQDSVLSVYHATSHAFSGTGTVKILENHLGRAFIRAVQVVQAQTPPSSGPQSQPAPAA